SCRSFLRCLEAPRWMSPDVWTKYGVRAERASSLSRGDTTPYGAARTGPCLCAPCSMAPRHSPAGTHSIIGRCPSSVFFGIQPLFAVGSSQCEGRRPSRFSARSWVCLGPVWPKLVDMRLTAFTDVSLRLIMRLAVAREGELLTTRTVAT